ncbi:hypothetical protein AAVH_16267 [Aphelenchoides avenae]|nr:hypothetical protein AAVH_16267 [Aphelenchus avenae]
MKLYLALVLALLAQSLAMPVLEAEGLQAQLPPPSTPLERERRGTGKGAILGGITGAVAGKMTGKSAAKGGLIGAIAGGIAGHKFGKNKHKHDQEMIQQ